jgi:hypothetical protein
LYKFRSRFKHTCVNFPSSIKKVSSTKGAGSGADRKCSACDVIVSLEACLDNPALTVMMMMAVSSLARIVGR